MYGFEKLFFLRTFFKCSKSIPFFVPISGHTLPTRLRMWRPPTFQQLGQPQELPLSHSTRSQCHTVSYGTLTSHPCPSQSNQLNPQAFGSGGGHQCEKAGIHAVRTTLQCQGFVGFLRTTPHLPSSETGRKPLGYSLMGSVWQHLLMTLKSCANVFEVAPGVKNLTIVSPATALLPHSLRDFPFCLLLNIWLSHINIHQKGHPLSACLGHRIAKWYLSSGK